MLLLVWLLVEILGSQGRFDIINSNPHYYTIVVLGLAPAFDMMVRALVRHMVGPMKGEGLLAERAYKSTKRSYIRIGRIIVFSAIILFLADLVEHQSLQSCHCRPWRTGRLAVNRIHDRAGHRLCGLGIGNALVQP